MKLIFTAALILINSLAFASDKPTQDRKVASFVTFKVTCYSPNGTVIYKKDDVYFYDSYETESNKLSVWETRESYNKKGIPKVFLNTPCIIDPSYNE